MSDYPFDSTGLNDDNYIGSEVHTIDSATVGMVNYIVPKNAPFFNESLVVFDTTAGRLLDEGTDYELGHPYALAQTNLNRNLSGSFYFLNPITNNSYSIGYRTLGGDFILAEPLEDGVALETDMSVDWSVFSNSSPIWPFLVHEEPIDDTNSLLGLRTAFSGVMDKIAAKPTGLNYLDINGFTEENVEALIDSLENIQNQISENGYKFFGHRISKTAPNRYGTTDLGNRSESMGWFNTFLKAFVDETGLYQINWSLPDDVVDDGIKLRCQIKVKKPDGAVVIPEFNYTNGLLVELEKNDTVYLEAMVKGTSSRFIINTTTAASTLVLKKVSLWNGLVPDEGEFQYAEDITPFLIAVEEYNKAILEFGQDYRKGYIYLNYNFSNLYIASYQMIVAITDIVKDYVGDDNYDIEPLVIATNDMTSSVRGFIFDFSDQIYYTGQTHIDTLLNDYEDLINGMFDLPQNYSSGQQVIFRDFVTNMQALVDALEEIPQQYVVTYDATLHELFNAMQSMTDYFGSFPQNYVDEE